jgi:citronellol/citronellal dehydrogenase
VADAAYVVLNSNAGTTTGNFFLDEDVLRASGVSDFDSYAVVPGARDLLPDLFV